MINSKYNVNDIVYVVKEFNIIKGIVKSIDIKITEKKSSYIYNIIGYKNQNDPKVRTYPFKECYLVDTLELAKASAKINLEQTYLSAKSFLNNLTNEMFEPVKEENDS